MIFAKPREAPSVGWFMELLVTPLASAAFFTLGAALLQTLRQHAESITPVLVWISLVLLSTIVIAMSVQY